MLQEVWIRNPGDRDQYHIIKKFGSIYYRLQIDLYKSDDTCKFWIGLGSGRKRKDLYNQEPDNILRLEGISPLIWVKNQIDSFTSDYINNIGPLYYGHKNYFIVIAWANSKRKRVYSWLLREGYYFSSWDGTSCLIKKLK